MTRTELHRGLTATQVAMLGLSGAIGTGIFLSTGGAIAAAGPAIVISFLATGLLTAVVVLAMAEMTSRHPVEGGVGTVADAYLGRTAGFVARWNLAIVCLLATGVQTVACATYLRAWFPQVSLGTFTVAFSLAMVALNFVAVKVYGAVEFWMSLLKVVVVIAFILLGAVLLGLGMPGSRPFETQLTAHGGFAPHGLSGIAIGAVIAIFSYGGCEMISVAATECKDPRRDIVRASRLMITGVVALYVLALGVIVTLMPWTDAAAGQGVAGSPFVLLLGRIGVPYAADALNALLVTAAFSAGLGLIYGGTRSLHALAVDDLAPRVLARTGENGAPTAAGLGGVVGMAVSSVVALAFPESAFMILVAVLTFGLALSWLVVLVTYVGFRVRRARHGLAASPAPLPGGLATAGVTLAVLVAMIAGLAFIDGMEDALTFGLPYLAALVIAGALVARRRVAGPTVVDEELLDVARERGTSPVAAEIVTER